LWRARAGAPVGRLAWSPGGRRLLVVTPAAVRILDARGHTRRVLRMPALTRARAVAWLPGGRRFALLRAGAAGSELLLVPAAPGATSRAPPGCVPGRCGAPRRTRGSRRAGRPARAGRAPGGRTGCPSPDRGGRGR